MVDKRQWKDDPFSEWRRELNRAEHRDVPRGDEETSESWKSDPWRCRLVFWSGFTVRVWALALIPLLFWFGLWSQRLKLDILGKRVTQDPFHGWRQTGALANETNIEQLQEAKAGRPTPKASFANGLVHGNLSHSARCL